MEHANDPAAACGSVDGVRAEEREGIGVTADDEGVDGAADFATAFSMRCSGKCASL